MKYWDDLRNKYGFNDGHCVPGGIEIYRKAYVMAMNRLLKKHDSGVRVVAWDRNGMHNWCLLLLVAMADISGLPEAQCGNAAAVEKAGICDEVGEDDGFQDAYVDAEEEGIDNYVEARARIVPEFKEYLKTIGKEQR